MVHSTCIHTLPKPIDSLSQRLAMAPPMKPYEWIRLRETQLSVQCRHTTHEKMKITDTTAYLAC
jgi:hypothetical protein